MAAPFRWRPRQEGPEELFTNSNPQGSYPVLLINWPGVGPGNWTVQPDLRSDLPLDSCRGADDKQACGPQWSSWSLSLCEWAYSLQTRYPRVNSIQLFLFSPIPLNMWTHNSIIDLLSKQAPWRLWCQMLPLTPHPYNPQFHPLCLSQMPTLHTACYCCAESLDPSSTDRLQVCPRTDLERILW